MTVALVQAATTLPMFLFSLPAGALADIVDRRRLLIVVQIAAAAVAALFAIFVWLDWVTPNWLLTFISLSGIATVLAMPSWQAIVPQLVPKEGLRSAVALNGIGLNISRAIGPALAGLAIGALGMAAPYWVRGRGMAMFATVQFAGLAVGSIVWGQAAQMIGLPAVHIIAAIALVASVPLLRRWKLQTAAGLDLAPSMHWPAPLLSHDIEPDRGPVLVTIEYVVAAVDRAAFLTAMAKLAGERRRDGAFDWGIYEDASKEGVFVETFCVDSWLDHMRQHQRVSNADRVLQDAVHRFQAKGTPAVRHLIAAQGSANG